MLAAALAWFVLATPQQPRFVLAPGSPVVVNLEVGRPELLDFDRDSDLDVVLAGGGDDHNGHAGFVLVLCNDGTGRLAAEAIRHPIPASARKLAVGDLDGDDYHDIVVADHDSYDVIALHNDGGKGLVPFAGSPFQSLRGSRPHTHDVVLADLDGDTRLDALTSNVADCAIAVLRGDGKGGFTEAAGSPFVTPWRHPYDALALGDFDRDGHTDVASPMLRDACIGWLPGDGKGALRLHPSRSVRVAERPGYLVAGDLDRDSDLDLVASHDDSGVIDILTNDGKGGFAVRSFDVGSARWGLALGDLDGDGDLDLAAGAQAGNVVVLLRGDGKGGFAELQRLEAGKAASYVVIGDLDGDLRLDVVVTCCDRGETWVYVQPQTTIAHPRTSPRH